MTYMGSKRRLSKHILPIMLQSRSESDFWVEPFVGGGNMIENVPGKRIGADSNKYAVEAMISIRDFIDDLPKNNSEFTEDDYSKLKSSDEYPHKGYAGFAFSFAGKWLGGWSRNSQSRDYIDRAYRSALKQSPKIQGVDFRCCSYLDLDIPINSVVYCDPPYENTTKYSVDFNHPVFWDWCRGLVDKGIKVFISEYNAPSDFRCVFEKPHQNMINNDIGAVERLFTI